MLYEERGVISAWIDCGSDWCACRGATNTTFVILNEEGRVLGEARGGGSNPWLSGVEAVGAVLVDLGRTARRAAGVPDDVPLVSCGFSMSGCEQKASQDAIRAHIDAAAPGLARSLYFYNDTVGSIFTASPSGGMVVIAGTGSMAQLMTMSEGGMCSLHQVPPGGRCEGNS